MFMSDNKYCFETETDVELCTTHQGKHLYWPLGSHHGNPNANDTLRDVTCPFMGFV